MLKIILALTTFMVVVLIAWAISPVLGVIAAAIGYGVLNGLMAD